MKFEKLGSNYAKFTFKVEPDIFKQGLDFAFDKIKDEVEVKGFRKGHVPRNIYDSKFGVESLYEEALNYAISANYAKVFEEKSVVIVGEAKIDVDVSKISHEEPFEVSLTFPIKPEVILGEYIGAEVEKADLEVTDEEVEEEIESLLARSKSLIPKEDDTLEEGDVSIIDYEGFLNDEPFEGGQAENHQLKIGSNMFIPGFEEKLIGMKLGEQRDINLTFPEEYHAEDLAGKEVVFKVKLNEIKVEKLSELNDEFVKNLNKEDVQTVDELKEDIKKNIAAYKEENEKNRIVGTAVKFAVDNATVDIPIEMLEYEKNNMIEQMEQNVKGQYGIELEMYVQLTGMTMEQFENEMQSQAQNRVLTTLVLEAISEKENFEVTDEEIEAKINEIAEMYNVEKAEVEKQLTKEMITREVQFNKTVDYLEENVKEVEKAETK